MTTKAHPSICPTITADNPHTYRTQVERIALFARRLHIDLADGVLAPAKLIDIDKVWWPVGMQADLHVMLEKPFDHIEHFLRLNPQLVIVHAEAEGDFGAFATTMRQHKIKAGVALLPETPVSLILSALDLIDHVLIFSGNFGHFGGKADLTLLDKAQTLRQYKPSLEIGWDGGVNDSNVQALASGGIDVLNVGGYIQRSREPAEAYDKLLELVNAAHSRRNIRVL